ncbi:MAG: hypothetical protein LBC64_01770 [Fibromonadaceae bacterium]|jgi:uncharacterized protein (TIGR02145 family)|nr:hypothetical protein [Fibromonadaceae bacterium]
MRICPLFAKLAAFGLAMALTFGCSSEGNNNSGGGGVVWNTTYCVVESMGLCVTGLTGKQCRDEGYKGYDGYFDTECPSGYDKVTVSGVSSSSGGSGSSSSATGNVVSSSSGGGSNPVGSSSSRGGGIVYGVDVSYQDEIYKTVKIGNQTWFQRNLNYNASGSKCGNGGSLSDANTTTCDTYGRLYDWATAMALPSKCNSILSTSDADCAITTPNHRGICPSGWHIPSDADWEALMTAVGGSGTAGTKLKANSDLWVSNGKGTDNYGFSALPGGYGGSGGYFGNVGSNGFWWSASEYNANYAYRRDMYYSYENVNWDYNDKSNYLFSVRCLQD